MASELTVIIPFLNENEEVYNTVKSLRDSTIEPFDIILINDCSTDGYDYQHVAEEFYTEYIVHTERKGVASSRDEGIKLCKTDFFLLLDAHMRVYQDNWVTQIVKEIKKIPKTFFVV